MSKRKSDFGDNLSTIKKRQTNTTDKLKHSLDSDEEDDVDESTYVLDDDKIEGEEEGIPTNSSDGSRFTAFNMKEEMEEGHFDRDGHFIWNNESEIKDNWLDNIDWQKIETRVKPRKQNTSLGLADESSDEEEQVDVIKIYKELATFMKPKENLSKTLQRLGGETRKLSSVERLKRKKAGTLNNNTDVIKVTELANKLLTSTGNMDIYQETYESIASKIHQNESKQLISKSDLNMFSDDFEAEEQKKISKAGPSNEQKSMQDELMWEYKLNKDDSKINGPFTTEQMNKWKHEGYFKTDVWIRKYNQESQFYSIKRIDFELYL